MDGKISLAPQTWQALSAIAAREQTSVNEIVRDAVRRDLFRRSRAKKVDRPDERLVAPLRALLADDFAYARDWLDLQAKLRNKGYELREAGGGVSLFDRATGARLCKGSDLGYSLSRLSLRFGSMFPTHSHRYLKQRLGI